MLEFITHSNAENPEFAVIWLHGLGADGHDFESIVEELNLDPAATIKFIFPHAPVMPVTINGGMRMRAWYDIAMADLGRQPDLAGIEQSAALVVELLDDLQRQGFAREKCFVVGFSQGGAVALHLATSESLAGVAALSSYGPTLPQAPALRTQNIWLGHGSFDGVVPLSLAEKTRDDLAGLGCSVAVHTYSMQHSVCLDELNDLSQWFNQTVAGF
jgi:phospholipase/carboxylesterase